jgi:hypothetical protein
MAGFQGSGSTTKGGFAPAGPSKGSPSIFGKALHLANVALVQPDANLLHDVTAAAMGLPMGLVGTVTHPVRAVETMAHTTWHTWSPLFHGDFQKFGKQVYDHPLAPLLDIASVFSLGLGTVAKGAELSVGAAGVARTAEKLSAAGPKTLEASQPLTKTEKIVALKMHKSVALDPVAGAADKGTFVKVMSRQPSRRLLQEGVMALDRGGHLPDWYVKGRYERASLVNLSHRVAAKKEVTHMALKKEAGINTGIHPVLSGADPGLDVLAGHGLMYRVILRAGATLSDATDLGKRARTSTFVGMYSGLVRHNTAYDLARADKLVKGGHHLYIVDPSYYDTKYWSLLNKQRRIHARATRDLSTHVTGLPAQKLARAEANLAHHEAQAQGLARTEKDLAVANEALKAYHDSGRVIEGGARDGSNRLISQPNKKQLMNYTAKDVHVLQERIKTLTAQRERALASQKATVGLQKRIADYHNVKDGLVNKVMESNDARMALENRSVEDVFARAGDTHDAFVKAVENFGHARGGVLTKNPNHALRDTNGDLFVAPAHDAYNLSIEAGNSVKMLRYVVHKPVQFWKDMTIKYTPRTITNNGVGNWLMYSLTHLGPGGMQAFGNAMKHEFPNVFNAKEVVGDNLYNRNHWTERLHLADLADNFAVGQSVVKEGAVHMDELSALGKFRQQGMYGLVNKTSERPVRIAALYHTYSAMSEVKAELANIKKTTSVRGKKALDMAIERAAKANPNLVHEASLAQRRVAGDYLTMNASEKWAKDLIPFYLWNRHILKNTGNILLDHPTRLAVGARLSQFGIQETESYGGNMPDFLKGAIPLAALGLGDRTGRMNFLATSSLNPYQTVGDMADSVDALAVSGGKRRGAAVSQANPLIVGGFESVFQTNALTGVPSPRKGGVIEDTIGRTLAQFPYVKAADVFSSGDQFQTPKGNDLMFGRTKTATISSLFGVPIKDTSLTRMHELADQLDGTKKKKGGHGFAG